MAALAAVLLALGSGVVWTAFQGPLGYPNGLNWHVVFGLALAVFVVLHIATRFKPLRRTDLAGRHALLGGLAALGTGGTLWAGQDAAAQALALPGARRRFTGSRLVGAEPGLTFPVTMWMADNPAPYAAAAWRLDITGEVAQPLRLSAADLAAAPHSRWPRPWTARAAGTRACRGIPVAWLLAQAGPAAHAATVSFVAPPPATAGASPWPRRARSCWRPRSAARRSITATARRCGWWRRAAAAFSGSSG